MPMVPSFLLPIVLLLISNVFMTFAWYGHLKFTDRPLWIVVLVSWCIAFIEYCLAVRKRLYSSAAQDHAGGHYPHRLCGVLSVGPEGIIHAQPSDRFCFDRGRRVLCLQGADLIEAIVTVDAVDWRKEPSQ